MSRKKVTFVTLDVLPQLAPLAGGYLQSYACESAEIRDGWQFEQFVSARAPLTPARLTAAMERSDADLYCFSCYSWNMGLIKAVLPAILKGKPGAHVLLGGPQAMHCAPRYLRPENENLLLCNGEGEKTFRNCLLELSRPDPDFAAVKGLSFYRNGRLTTTEPEPRIVDLDEIPSPILAGLFDPARYMNMVMETNRGCPFSCSYCYWGAAIGAKVHRFSTARIMREMEWISRNNVFSLAIVDANWGIFPRDVDLTRYLIRCRDTYGAPRMVGFSASKNTAERVTEITKLFHDANLLFNHTISLQTTEPSVLKNVGRQNIKTQVYMEMQKYMNSAGIGSHVELIWPLPGETLASLIAGVDRLCRAGADMFFCHPLFLINNVEMNNRREEFGLVVIDSPDEGSEAEIVVRTKDVSFEEYTEGWRFMFSTIVLHNLRSFRCLARYLAESGADGYSALYLGFARFLKASPELPLARLIEEISLIRSVEPITLGRLVYHMHASRPDVNAALLEFFRSQPWSGDRMAQIYFEIDLLNRPQVYHPAAWRASLPFGHVEVTDAGPDGYRVVLPEDCSASVAQTLGASFRSRHAAVDHARGQNARLSSLPVEACWMQCYQSAFSVAKYAPAWSDCAPDSLRVTAGS